MKAYHYRWEDVQRIDGYKRDELVVDAICLDIQFASNYVTVSEDTANWREFLGALYARFPGIDRDWQGKIMLPAFVENRTVLYRRGQMMTF